MIDFDKIKSIHRVRKPTYPRPHTSYGSSRPMTRRPRFFNPRRHLHPSRKIAPGRQLYIIFRHSFNT